VFVIKGLDGFVEVQKNAQHVVAFVFVDLRRKRKDG
jgi:hypothetical protein